PSLSARKLAALLLCHRGHSGRKRRQLAGRIGRFPSGRTAPPVRQKDAPGRLDSRYHPRSAMKFCDKCHSTYPTEFATCPKDQSKLRVVSELQRGMELRGKYRIEEKIGEGGMATVYRAAHLHFKEDLAIKVVSSALTANQDFLNRFKREAVITRKLRHPNAVRLDDFDFTEDGRPFIAMEYVRGKSLRQ